MQHETVIVLDFGGQYNQLIARRVRENNVYCEIYSYKTDLSVIKAKNPKGIIFTGGPNSVYLEDSPTIDPEIFSWGVPVLGICYGSQLMMHLLGGHVCRAPEREYGKTEVFVNTESKLFTDVQPSTICWMSHNDYIEQAAPGFQITAHTANCPVAAVENAEKGLYAVQFHPEVLHTAEGKKMLRNFVYNVCGCSGDWKMDSFVENNVKALRERIGEGKVLCALSGGVFFIMVMLAMAIGMPSTLKYYQSRTADMMFTNYQYVLKSCEDENGDAVTTQNPDAEAFCMTSLVRKSDVLDEEVSVYGIADGSRYVQIDNLSGLEGNKVYISAPYADKYRLAVGDTFTLDEKYESKQYTFTVAGIYDRCQSIAVFLPMDHYRDIFDLDADAFSGFLSDTEITDIDEDNVATVITERDITKMADQLDHSMGSYMTYFQYLCVLLSAVLIYLLTKLIIEKNENAISMVKILGYENREIARLYLLSTTIVLVLIDAVSVWLGAAAMKLAWREIMFSYSGWFAFHMEPAGYVKMFVFVLLGYAIVTIFDFRRIRKIPMDEALKSAE